MMKFRKLSIVVIVLVVVAMLFVGCETVPVETEGDGSAIESADNAQTEDTTEGITEETETVDVEDGITIGFSFPTLQEERWSIEKDLAVEYCEKLGVELLFTDANTESTLQNQQIDNLITQGIDVLIVGAADIDATASAVQAAKDEGIPVISYLRMINSDQLDAFVGYDFQKIGEIKAQAALDAVPEGNYVFLNGDEGDSVVHKHCQVCLVLQAPELPRRKHYHYYQSLLEHHCCSV